MDDQPDGKKIFYWYIESERDPSTDPVVLWTNGGPGCSGLLGLFTENGPFVPTSDGKLVANDHSWNKIAKVATVAPQNTSYHFQFYIHFVIFVTVAVVVVIITVNTRLPPHNIIGRPPIVVEERL